MTPQNAIPRLEFRNERLRATFRAAFAFHAREVRFERLQHGEAEGAPARYVNLFPETFSFHAERHDPSELYLRFDDLWSHPRRLHAQANRRDAEEFVFRVLEALPRELTGALNKLEGAADNSTVSNSTVSNSTVSNSAAADALLRCAEDAAVFSLVVMRFAADKNIAEKARLAAAILQLRAVLLRALNLVAARRVSPEFKARYLAGEARAEISADPYDLSFFYALARGNAAEIDAQVMGAAERAYHRWLEDVCLASENRVFEREDSPFAERAAEVMRAVATDGQHALRGRDLCIYLRRPQNRDCLRLLQKLERWFLHQYDVRHAAVIRQHLEAMRAGRADGSRRLTFHSGANYALALSFAALPFLAAVFFYDDAPRLLDWWATLEVLGILAAAVWYLGWRFLWRKDLTFFHTSVPRIGAGIIVGYLPVFLIDEVWDLAEQAPFYLLAVSALLGATTFLYIYVEVQRKLGNAPLAFARARAIFLLGLVQAGGFGLLVTSLLGGLMAGRNWGPAAGASAAAAPGAAADGAASLAGLRGLEPWLGELPRIMGVEPFFAFPTAVLVMSFLSFFIGTFLQLLWEELPITEPL